jgi:hypothetical protein
MSGDGVRGELDHSDYILTLSLTCCTFERIAAVRCALAFFEIFLATFIIYTT